MVIFCNLLFILHLGAFWGLDVQFLECVSLGCRRLGASRPCPQWAQCWGYWRLEHCSVSMRVPALPRSLAAEETSPSPVKRQDSSSSHPHFLSVVYGPLNGFALTRETKEPFRLQLLDTASALWAFVNALSPPFLSGQPHAHC